MSVNIIHVLMKRTWLSRVAAPWGAQGAVFYYTCTHLSGWASAAASLACQNNNKHSCTRVPSCCIAMTFNIQTFTLVWIYCGIPHRFRYVGS